MKLFRKMRELLSVLLCIRKMKQLKKPQNGFRQFIHRNRILLILSLISIVLFIKHTSAPFLWDYNCVTRFLFCIPLEGTISSAVFDFAYNLGIAFIASFIFYLVVDYFPKRDREKAAFLIIKENIESIDIYLNKLFSYLLFIGGIGDCPSHIHPSKIFEVKSVHLRYMDRACHTKLINLQSGEIEFESNPEYINEIGTLKNVCTAINARIDETIKLPCAHNIDPSILDALSVLKNNKMLLCFQTIPDSEYLGTSDYIGAYHDRDIAEVVIQRLILQRYPYPKHEFSITETTEKDIQDTKEQYDRMKKQFPEAFERMEKYNDRHKTI